jgi:hypothetical protein
VPEKLRRIFIATLIVGLLGTMWDLAGVRYFRGARVNGQPFTSTNLYPTVDYELRAAYSWADKNLPQDAVIQHNPVRFRRALDFGLYSHAETGVADMDARLFGAPKAAVLRRIRTIAPVFAGPMPRRDVASRLHSAGVDYLVVTAIDPVWATIGGPPSDWTCVYRSRDVCLARVGRGETKP